MYLPDVSIRHKSTIKAQVCSAWQQQRQQRMIGANFPLKLAKYARRVEVTLATVIILQTQCTVLVQTSIAWQGNVCSGQFARECHWLSITRVQQHMCVCAQCMSMRRSKRDTCFAVLI